MITPRRPSTRGRQFPLRSDPFLPGHHPTGQVLYIGKTCRFQHHGRHPAAIPAAAIDDHFIILQGFDIIDIHLLDTPQRQQYPSYIKISVFVRFTYINQVKRFTSIQSFLHFFNRNSLHYIIFVKILTLKLTAAIPHPKPFPSPLHPGGPHPTPSPLRSPPHTSTPAIPTPSHKRSTPLFHPGAVSSPPNTHWAKTAALPSPSRVVAPRSRYRSPSPA